MRAMSSSARRWLAALGLAAVLAGVGGFWVLRGATPTVGGSGDALRGDAAQTTLGALATALEEEHRARVALAEEVARLRADVFALTLRAGLESRSDAPGRAPADGEAGSRPAGEGVGPEAGTAEEPPAGEVADTTEDRPWFDDSALAALGIDASSVAWLRERWSRHELERLAINDRAVREGRLMGPEHRRELQDLESDLVSELGTDRYDLMLYATNQPNRVVVTDLIDGSVASRAGVRPGDVIEGYDGAPIFRQSDLLLKMADGVVGQTVRLEVVRGGLALSISVPRGPLGVRLKPTSIPPPGG